MSTSMWGMQLQWWHSLLQQVRCSWDCSRGCGLFCGSRWGWNSSWRSKAWEDRPSDFLWETYQRSPSSHKRCLRLCLLTTSLGSSRPPWRHNTPCISPNMVRNQLADIERNPVIPWICRLWIKKHSCLHLQQFLVWELLWSNFCLICLF